MPRRLRVFFLFLFLVAPAATEAHSYQQGNIRIGHIWMRATAPGTTTAAIYAPLLNLGGEPDELITVSSTLASKIEIHQEVDENGVMKMQKLEMIELDPGKPVSLRPGGTHLMVFGLKKQLQEGDRFPIILTFKKAGATQVDVLVQSGGPKAETE